MLCVPHAMKKNMYLKSLNGMAKSTDRSLHLSGERTHADWNHRHNTTTNTDTGIHGNFRTAEQAPGNRPPWVQCLRHAIPPATS